MHMIKKLGAGIGATLAAGSAFAAAPDTTSITTAITENAGAATLVVIAFIGALWGLKSLGLLKRG